MTLCFTVFADSLDVMDKRQKLSAFAASQGLSYQAAWKLWEKGEIEGIKLDSGTILVTGWVRKASDPVKAVIYARVGSVEDMDLLKANIAIAEQYAIDCGYQVVGRAGEACPGMMFNRQQLAKVMDDKNWEVLIVNDAHEISQLNFDTIQQALALGGRRIECINPTPEQPPVEPLVNFSQKFVHWAKQFMGTGHQKKDLFNLLRELNK